LSIKTKEKWPKKYFLKIQNQPWMLKEKNFLLFLRNNNKKNPHEAKCHWQLIFDSCIIYSPLACIHKCGIIKDFFPVCFLLRFSIISSSEILIDFDKILYFLLPKCDLITLSINIYYSLTQMISCCPQNFSFVSVWHLIFFGMS